MGGVEDLSLLHRPFLRLGACKLSSLVAHQRFCMRLATAGCGELFEMCFCLGSVRFRGIIGVCAPTYAGCALIVQLAETEDLKSLCSGFESQWGHGIDAHRRAV